ncbi:MAG: TolC family protein [Spirochaetaceae bacterium]|jgi:outer membrane protein TolC|nr:TolC family protein [Spirochaetaceae bacterium]
MKITGLLLAAVLPSAAAFGLDLETVRSLALANSRTLARYNLAVENALLDEKILTFDTLPSLSLGASASANIWGFSQGSVSLEEGLSGGINFGVTQRVYNGGKNALLKSIARMTTGIARQEAAAEYFAVLDAADAAYYGALESGAVLESSEAALEAAVFALSMAEIRLESGMIGYSDYLYALAEKEAKETLWNQSRRDCTLAAAALKNLTGLAELSGCEAIDGEAWEGIIQKLAGLSEESAAAFQESFRTTAAANNPALVKAALAGSRAEQAVSLAKREYLPSLSVGVSGGIEYSPLNGAPLPSGRLSLNAAIPLDIWVTGAAVEKKEYARTEAALEKQSAAASLNLEIQTAVLDLITRAMSVLSSRRADEYARRHYEQVLERYRLSNASVAELSDAAALAGSNRTQYIKAWYGFLRDASRLRSLGCFSSDEDLRAAFLSW